MIPPAPPRDDGWVRRARLVSLGLFAVWPAVHLFARTGSEIIVAVIGLSFLAVLLGERWWAVLRTPPVAVLIGAWIVLMAVVSPLAWDAEASFWRALPWFRYICLFAAVAFWLFRDDRDLRMVVSAWAVVLALVAVDGLVQMATGTSLTGQPLFEKQRLTGPLDRPNIGSFSAKLFFPVFAAALFLHEPRLGRRGAAGLGLALLAAVAFVTLTADRGATLLSAATVATAALALIAFYPRYRAAAAGALGAVAAVVAAAVAVVPRLRTRTADLWNVLGDFSASAYGGLYDAAITIWATAPLTGVGVRNYEAVCQALELKFKGGCLRHAHNIYLEWLADTGLVGLACFLAFVAAVIALVLRPAAALEGRPLTGVFLPSALIVTLFPLVPSQSFFSNWPAILWWSSLSLTAAVAVRAARSGRG